MSFFATKFQGAPFQVTDARQTQDFLNRHKEQERKRKDEAKKLAEDQKRLGMIAQGMGMEKGNVDAMSRGELQGFIESNIMQSKAVKGLQEDSLNLQKFMAERKAQENNQAYNAKIAQAQLLNAQTQSTNAYTANTNALNKFRADTREIQGMDEATGRLMQNLKIYGEVLAEGVGGPSGFNAKQYKRSQEMYEKYPEVMNQAMAGARPQDVYQTFLDTKMPDPTDIEKTPDELANAQAQKTLAMEASKSYQEWIDTGGHILAEEKIKTMTKVMRDLDAGRVDTGSLIDFISETGKKILDAESVEARQAILTIAQQQLKATLGGQFTEREAKQFFERAYDPQLPAGSNIRKIKKAIREIAKLENYKMQYFKRYGEDPSSLGTFMYDPTVSTFNADGTDATTSTGTGFEIVMPGTDLEVK